MCYKMVLSVFSEVPKTKVDLMKVVCILKPSRRTEVNSRPLGDGNLNCTVVGKVQ